jgi:hypothetical protein
VRVTTSPWDVRGSGLRSVGSGYNRLRGRSLRIQQAHGDDRRKRRWDHQEETPEYKQGETYTRRQLTLMADHILAQDPKPESEHPMILNEGMYERRLRREIYCKEGTPDPEIVSGLYWRTHPQGRKVNSDEQRDRNGASYYR